ncbi:MAG: hypothetical protein R8K50_03075, partial [Mariprofundus sp.]
SCSGLLCVLCAFACNSILNQLTQSRKERKKSALTLYDQYPQSFRAPESLTLATACIKKVPDTFYFAIYIMPVLCVPLRPLR